MKLNDKVIRVFMPFTPGIIYTKDDVVFGEDLVLRICLKTTLLSTQLTDINYYKPFVDPNDPGMVDNLTEYNDPAFASKPVSKLLFQQVISQYLMGYTTAGIITEFAADDINQVITNSKFIIPNDDTILGLPANLVMENVNILTTTALSDGSLYQQIASIDYVNEKYSLYYRLGALTYSGYYEAWIPLDFTELNTNLLTKLATVYENYNRTIAYTNELIDRLNNALPIQELANYNSGDLPAGYELSTLATYALRSHFSIKLHYLLGLELIQLESMIDKATIEYSINHPEMTVVLIINAAVKLYMESGILKVTEYSGNVFNIKINGL